MPSNATRITYYVLRFTQYRDSILLFLASFTLYTLTLSPGLLPADSGEFQVVVPLLGVAHPPGFSLYTLLGRIFVSVARVGSYAYRLNLFSAFTSSLTLVLVNRAVYRLVARNLQSEINNLKSRIPGLLAAFVLGVSTTFWSQATTANIRSLMALLTALAVCALVEYRLNPTLNRLAFFAFALALAVVHHLSIAFIAVILAISAILGDLRALRGFKSADWLKIILAALLPLAVLLYLPVRGAAGAFLAPPDLDTFGGFIQHALGLGFGGDFFYFANPVHWPDRFAILLDIFLFQFNAVALILLALGLLLFFFHDWKLAAALTFAFAVHCFVAITYRAPQTVEYLLPAYVILAIASAAGLGQLSIPNSKFPIPNSSFAILHLSLFIASLFILIRNYPAYRSLANDNSTRDYAESALTLANPNAVILASWHYATPMWYLQYVEGKRPDVTVEYVFPQGASLAQNWVDRIGANVAARPTLVTNFYPAEYAATQYHFPHVGLLWQAGTQPLLFNDGGMSRREGGWTLVTGGAFGAGFSPGQTTYATAMWRAPEQPADINFFVQLLGPDGLLYGQMDVSHSASHIAANEVLSDRYDITPNIDARPGDYRLVAGAYLPDGTRLACETPCSPDNTTLLAAVTVVPRTTPPATRHPQPFGLLAGYDYDLSIPDSPRLYLHWRLDGKSHIVRADLCVGPCPQVDPPSGDSAPGDHTGSPLQIILPALTGYLTTSHDLPAGWQTLNLAGDRLSFVIHHSSFASASRYISFGPLTLVGATTTREGDGSYRVDLEWMANEPITGDYIVKVDLVGENYAWRDQSDSVPAGGAIPTLKWIPGIMIRDRHRLTPQAQTPAAFHLAVYDHFTQRNLPILDSRLALLGPSVALGAVQP